MPLRKQEPDWPILVIVLIGLLAMLNIIAAVAYVYLELWNL